MVTFYVPRGYGHDVHVYSMAVDADERITPHFTVREFACKDGADEVVVDTALVYLLEDLRVFYGSPITIVSGYRTPEHNEKVGGASNSYHMKGMAADIRVAGVPPARVYSDLNPVHTGGLGKYNTFTHIDTRGTRARWQG